MNKQIDRRRVIYWLSVLPALSWKGIDYMRSKLGKRLGVTSASYVLRNYAGLSSASYPAFSDALDMMDHCRGLGAGGIQVGVRGWSIDFAREIRQSCEESGFYLEGQIRLPGNRLTDLSRFVSEIEVAREAGIEVIRTVCLSGRRYEDFDSLSAFQAFKRSAYESLEWSEPIVRKYGIVLAIENHKDWRIEEFHALLRTFESKHIRVTLDTGNNISLLEDPLETAKALAPYTVTVHLKDMALEAHDEGFRMSEVPLGHGFLNLKEIIDICEKANPDVRYNLEMITRDPLQIPCLTESYWSTLREVAARDLGEILRSVRANDQGSLPTISDKDDESKLAIEEENVLESFRYARNHLGFD